MPTYEIKALDGRPAKRPDHARIKRNIAKMIDQGATEAEIDQYVASEKVTPAQLRAAPKPYVNPKGPLPERLLTGEPYQQNGIVMRRPILRTPEAMIRASSACRSRIARRSTPARRANLVSTRRNSACCRPSGRFSCCRSSSRSGSPIRFRTSGTTNRHYVANAPTVICPV